MGALLEDLGINARVWATQVAIFAATFVILSRLLFGRVLATLQAREEEVRQAREEIRRRRDEASRRAAEYEDHIARMDQEANAWLQAEVRDALAKAQAQVAQAQALAQEETRRTVAEIVRSGEDARERLPEEVSRLTHEMVRRVLGVPLDPGVSAGAVRRLAAGRG